jgi:hypothetical protein
LKILLPYFFQLFYILYEKYLGIFLLVYYIEGMELKTTRINAKKCHIFVCESCDFKCCKESNYKIHLDTIKHKRLHETTKKTSTIEQKSFVCICGKKYNHHSSLAKHKRTCIAVNTPITISEHIECITNTIKDVNTVGETDYVNNNEPLPVPNYSNFTKDEILLKLIKDNDEMMKIIKGQQEQINSIIPKIGNVTNNNNTTNNFNLNVFLNEHCKDALNISDFIDSLKITLEDLLFSKTNGISRGITDVMIKGLKELDIYKRPIHCTDIKRDIMYIKDEDKWSKDENHDMMKNTIVKIADKERTALQKWAIDNPDWMETERKQLDYLTMVRSICEPIENYDNYERKIIKNLGKEILIDKKN